jgi:hypothetical protein
LAIVLSALAGAVLAQAVPARVLVPLLWEGPGAGGSQWHSELTISNSADEDVKVGPGSPECQFELCDRTVNTGHQVTYVAYGGAIVPGSYFSVLADDPRNVNFLLRVWDSSREAENFGVTVPVVRAEEFRTSRFELLHVPTGPGFRANLRLYEYRPTNGLDVRVRIVSELSDTTIAEAVVPLRGGDVLDDYPLRPSYGAIYDLVGMHPEIAAEPFVRIRVEPIGETNGVWGFISVTNNSTQVVTIVAPE